ncbi:hypothetical protein JW968_02375 [Candidatus Woesearchaeota archaeon]|nr:hypothetical protein [Candidatus Woesearchaeota archaeon]
MKSASEFWKEHLGASFEPDYSLVGKKKTLDGILGVLASASKRFGSFVIVGDSWGDGIVLNNPQDFDVYVLGYGNQWEGEYDERLIKVNDDNVGTEFDRLKEEKGLEDVLFLFDADETLIHSEQIVSKAYENAYRKACNYFEIEEIYSGTQLFSILDDLNMGLSKNRETPILMAVLGSYLGLEYNELMKDLNGKSVTDYLKEAAPRIKNDTLREVVEVANGIMTNASEKFNLWSLPYIGNYFKEFREEIAQETNVENLEPHLNQPLVSQFRIIFEKNPSFRAGLYTLSPYYSWLE